MSAMIGKTISHYKIFEKIGEGGMGVIYKAQDTKLKRTVALKFLPQNLTRDTEAVKRLINEAQAASALDHPNICTIYEFDETVDGRMFIVMAYCDGSTLKQKLEKGALSIGEAVNIAAQIANALDKAHSHGIVHRDIKPANIILANDETVKIVDFGLAKIANVSITNSIVSLGTLAYMSPEQVRGETVDERTDIWSWGVVLYEMLTGQLPFKNDYEQAIAYLIVNKEPEYISRIRDGIPMKLQKVIQKTLEKRLAERYQSIADVRQELNDLGSEASTNMPVQKKATMPSIAILPFMDMSQQQDQEFFSDGLAEDITNALCKINDLRVVAGTSTFSFRGKQQDLREIGKRLNVEHVLKGSVRKAGTRLRITAQLIKTNEGHHLWSERFEREIDDLFSIQDEITEKIVDKLKVHLWGEQKQRGVTRYTENMKAYELYLKGRYFWNRRYEGGIQKAITYFNGAIEEDPAYALAYSGLADCFAVMGFYTYLEPKASFPKAKAAVQQALEIDDKLAEAHASNATVRWLWDRQYSEAERDFLRAIELKPGYATAYWWYAVYLASIGCAEESLLTYKRALDLDPVSLIACTGAGYVCYLTRQFDDAIENCMKTLEMEPTFGMAHYFLGRVYEQKKMYDESIAAFEQAKASLGDNSLALLAARPYALSGKKDEARRLLAEAQNMSKQRYVSSYYIAAIHLALNEQNVALRHLETALQQHDPWLVFLNVDTVFDNLRDNPEFGALLKKLGLQP